MKNRLALLLLSVSLLTLASCGKKQNKTTEKESDTSSIIESESIEESESLEESESEDSSTSSETSEDESSQSESASEEAKDKYTILVYLCGSDLESGYDPETRRTNTEEAGYATLNLKEMLSISYPSNVNVVIQTGGSRAWADPSLGIKSDKIGRWHIENKKLVNDAQLTKASMGASSTLQSFLEWGLTTYPAEKTGLVFWNHGGATDGFCSDELYGSDGDLLSPVEYQNALSKAISNVGIATKLEWVGYDCCLMQYQDLAAFNALYFNYAVGSQETEPGEGWDYDGWLDDLANNPDIQTTVLLKEIVDTFVQKCVDINNEYADYIQYLIDSGEWRDYESDGYTLDDFKEMVLEYRDYNDATLSVLDLSKMDAYITAWEDMTNALSITSSSKWRSLTSVIKKSQQFGYYDDEYGYAYDVYDVDDFLKNLKNSTNTTYKNSGADKTLSALSDLVFYNSCGKDSAGACGLCFYAMINGWINTSNVKNSRFTNWYNINKTYGTTAN